MEILAHFRSLRLLVLLALLAILVLGASYGLSRPLSIPSPEQLEVYAHPASVNQSGVRMYVAIGFLADLYGNPQPGRTVSLFAVNQTSNGSFMQRFVSDAVTNASGFVAFDLGSIRPEENDSYRFQTAVQVGSSEISFASNLESQSFTVALGPLGYANPQGLENVFSAHIMGVNGEPAIDAQVFLNETFLGRPNAQGLVRIVVPEGEHLVRIARETQEETFRVVGVAPSVPAYAQGPDAVLGTIAFAFMPLLLPVIAIAISFDAIAGERSQGSLELLFCSRVSRAGIVLGKFWGNFLPVALPVVIVILGGSAVITLVSGRSPDPRFAAFFVLGTLFLISVYTLMIMVFSTLARSLGSAIVLAISFWLVSSTVFNFLLFLALVASGQNPASRGFYEILSLVLLMNPNALYQMTVGAGLPTGTSAGLGLVPSGFLPVEWTLLAIGSWLLILFCADVWLFSRRSDL
ncbi:MAG TPA: ABC transporter permease [Thermoplasmata archaeon]|nr:ABC transporter permease [Thermoplasmata archaeon]